MIPLSVAWDAIGGLVDAHERFLAGARVDSDVRDSVLDSWKRCRYAGVEPDRLLIPYAPDLTLDHRFLRAAEPVLKRLTVSLAELNTTVALCDGQARMIQRYGGDRALRARLDGVNFAPGFDASERAAGTNGVGTALAGRSPVYVAGREHFADCLQPFACAGAPIRNPLSGRIEAVLDLTCLHDDGDPAMMRFVREAVRDIETRLLEQATERERALLTAYRRADHAAHGPHVNEGAVGGWPPRLQTRPPHVTAGHEPARDGDALGPIDLAVLREKAEALIAAPHRTLDEVLLSGGRSATLLRRQIEGAAGETGVVVEARVLGGPRLRHTAPTANPVAGVPTVPQPTRTPPSSCARSPTSRPRRRRPPKPTHGCSSSASPAWDGSPCWPAGGWSCCTTPGSGSAPPSTSPAPPRN